ncbi:MAG: glycosyltransferase family 2 protein [bacterium]
MVVTIITPSYNQGDYIEQTIKSVINQTYPHIEYFIYDGCSTDRTYNVLKKYAKHKRVAGIVMEKDNGQADVIIKGFKRARGEIVGWINSDDRLAPNIVEKSVDAFNKNEYISITYGDIQFIDNQGRNIKKKIPYSSISKDYLLNTNYVVYQQGSFYRKKIVEQIGYLNKNLYYCMDLDLWLKLLDGYQARYLQGTAGYFRLYKDTKTSTGGITFLFEIYNTLKKHGAKRMSRTKRQIIWYILKTMVKQSIIKCRK